MVGRERRAGRRRQLSKGRCVRATVPRSPVPHSLLILTAVPYAQISVQLPPISEVSKRNARTASAPRACASCVSRSMTCWRLIALLHLIGDGGDPYGIVGALMTAAPSGSYLTLSQVASDIQAEQMAEARQRHNSMARETQRHRSHAEVARFFAGLELLPPGLVPVQQWRPQSALESQARSAMWGGVARKP